jgi:hypothetical protein
MNMRRLWVVLVVTVLTATSAKAGVYDDCEAAIADGDMEAIEAFADEIRGRIVILKFQLSQAEACVSAADGTPMIRVDGTWLDGSIVAARLEAQAAAEAERIERQRVQSELETELAKLEKHNSCISAKRSELLSDIEAVDIQNNETNNSLIINDTYSACSELYLKDESSVMLNQSCIDAFKRLGHPNLVLAGDEFKSSFVDQLGELSTLRANLVMEQNKVTDALRTFMGFSNSQDIRSAALEEKSCAEFGYQGIYRD